MPDPVSTALLIVALGFVIGEDLRSYRIRNSAVLATVLLLVVSMLAEGRLIPLAWHAALAAIVFFVVLLPFRWGWLGGGDAKLLTSAYLWVGPEGAVLFAAALLGCSLVYVIGAHLRLLPSRRIGERVAVPFGPAIATAWAGTALFGLWH